MTHRFVLEIRDRILAHVLHAHPDHRRHHQQPVDQGAPMLRGRGVGGVEVKRVGVHRHEREPGVVEVRNRATWPVLESLADGEILEVAIHAIPMRVRVFGNYTTGAPVAIDCASFVESMARFTKLLVANRGEIALRIIRSARVFGLKTVAVYSAADANSAHVGAADEAIPIGPAEAAKSYLDIAAIIAAARQCGADAIHPGYGFLSERPEFARAAAEAQIVFVGPRPEVMAALGDKVAARRMAIDAGVPVVPGIETAEISAAREF